MDLEEFRQRAKQIAGPSDPRNVQVTGVLKPPHQQLIYAKALKEPRIGYEKHPLFRRAPFTCPQCGAWPWVRLRKHSDSVIGCICPDCNWTSTYTNKPALPRAPHQPDLPGNNPTSP